MWFLYMTGITLRYVNISPAYAYSHSQFARPWSRGHELYILSYPMPLKNTVYRPRKFLRLPPAITVDIFENLDNKFAEFIQSILYRHLEGHQKNTNQPRLQ
jgi:hypothetical protein